MLFLTDMIVEIPRNSNVKYEYDKKLQKMRCDRIIKTAMLYPGNYGYIPNTLSGDGDPIDILLLCDYPIYPGTVVNVKVIGVLLTTDESGDDEKLIAVPSKKVDSSYVDINNYNQLSKVEINKIKPKTKIGLSSLLNLLEKWRFDLKKKLNHNKLLQIVLDESGYSEMLKNKKDLENENRLENIKELLSAMKEFDNLESFLEHVSLATSLDQDWESEKVNLMTLHASKGLEFNIVYLPGWEEGLFPHQKSIEEKGESGLEEERRLAYVGITRAKKIAKISFSMNRFYQGDWMDSIASRFVDELPDEFLKKNNSFIDENENDFDFNQDIEFESEIRSPGWLRYQKKLK